MLGVLAEAVDQVGDARAEALTDLVELDVSVLDDVVQVGGRDQRAVIARVLEQAGDRDRVLDELLSGLLAVLAEVDPAGEAKCGGRQIRGVGLRLRTVWRLRSFH